MVEIIVYPSVKEKIRRNLSYTKHKFGEIATIRWNKEFSKVLLRLSNHPESSPIEEDLKNYEGNYRSTVIRKIFKLIYRFDKTENKVFIVDLWDARMSLENRIFGFQNTKIEHE